MRFNGKYEDVIVEYIIYIPADSFTFTKRYFPSNKGAKEKETKINSVMISIDFMLMVNSLCQKYKRH